MIPTGPCPDARSIRCPRCCSSIQVLLRFAGRSAAPDPGPPVDDDVLQGVHRPVHPSSCFHRDHLRGKGSLVASATQFLRSDAPWVGPLGRGEDDGAWRSRKVAVVATRRGSRVFRRISCAKKETILSLFFLKGFQVDGVWKRRRWGHMVGLPR